MNADRQSPINRASTVATVAVFAAVIVALGAIFIPLPFSPVPITGQTLGVLLAANILGPRKGAAAILLVLALAAAGVPVFAGGRGGMGVLVGASGGYFVGWVLVGLVLGAATSPLGRERRSLVIRLVLNLSLGVFLVYVPGVVWLAFVTDRTLAEAIAVGMTPFLPGDFVKAAVAAIAAHAVLVSYRAAVPALRYR